MAGPRLASGGRRTRTTRAPDDTPTEQHHRDGAAHRAAVERAILDMVRTGELQPGDRLGSERELTEHFGVTRFILRRALDALERSGTVRRVPGRNGGTFIRQAKVERDLSNIVGVPEYLLRQGFEAGTNVISAALRAADTVVAGKLGIAASAPVIDLVRLRLANGEPLSLEHAILPAERFPGLLERPLGGCVMTVLRDEYGIVVAETTERIEVVMASVDEGRLLGIPAGNPLLSVERVARTQEGQPFEYSVDLFRADRTRIAVKTIGAGNEEGAPAGGTEVRLKSL